MDNLIIQETPDFILKQTKNKGAGVFANRDFQKDEFLCQFNSDKIYTREDAPGDFNAPLNYYLQIGANTYIKPASISLFSIAYFVNHGCDPNGGLRINKEADLYAIKNIQKGEEVIFDYSTTMYNDKWTMKCCCESENCRGLVREFKYLPEAVQLRYVRLQIVPDYILQTLHMFYERL
jgi:SET domain-containing protein